MAVKKLRPKKEDFETFDAWYRADYLWAAVRQARRFLVDSKMARSKRQRAALHDKIWPPDVKKRKRVKMFFGRQEIPPNATLRLTYSESLRQRT